jgi:hypothetical protein
MGERKGLHGNNEKKQGDDGKWLTVIIMEI